MLLNRKTADSLFYEFVFDKYIELYNVICYANNEHIISKLKLIVCDLWFFSSLAMCVIKAIDKTTVGISLLSEKILRILCLW